MMDGRPLDHRLARSDEFDEVLRFELVGVVGKGCQVADTVVAGAGAEHGLRGQRTQGRVAAGAAAANGDAPRVDQPFGDEMFTASTQSVTSSSPHFPLRASR